MTINIDAPQTDAWWQDHDEITGFASALVEGGRLISASDVLYFFEKPWKWTAEHDAWVGFDRPGIDDPINFDRWLR